MEVGPGARLDTYEILSSLGRGGMGEVWLARDLRLDRKVAIKVLPPQLTDDPDRVARFRHEARTASALNHPNVCTIYTLGTAGDGRLFIAMEYIEGSTLRERLGANPLPVRKAVDIAAQMASGLSAAHAAGVIHRDVKPENVMVRSDGLVKVLDFGLAKLDPAIVSFEPAPSTRTALHTDGSVGGTIAYMSPEQASGHALDARTDIFSLGAVMYEMLTGRQPFSSSSPALVLDSILNRFPVSPIRLNPEVRPRLEDIIMKALEKDRDLRYQSASELRTDLNRLKRDTDAPGVPVLATSDASVASHGPRRGSRRVALAAGLLLAALLGVVAFRWRSVRDFFFRSELQEVQLTTNSSENPVSAAAISPDGKYIAYADQAGIHLRLIDSGETHTIAAPDIGDVNRVFWFPDGSKLVVSDGGAVEGAQPAIWSVSIVGGTPRKLREDGIEACVSRDGSQIAFVDVERRHIWLMSANGEDPHPVVTGSPEDTFYLPRWWANGARLGYGRVRSIADKSGAVKIEVSAESRDRKGRTAVAFSDPGLRAGIHLPDGRWLYSVVAEPTLDRDASLWEGRLDPRTGGLSGKRQRRDWPGSVYLREFSSSSDGKHVAFLKRSLQKDVYVADLTPDGSPANPRRFTLDDSMDFVTNWTHDSKAILFSSDRNGTFDIFKQPLDQRVAEAIVSGPDDETGPTAVSPDGKWFYYLVSSKGWRLTPARGNAVLRTPAAGGPREKVADESRPHWALCARASSTVCVLVEQDSTQLSIYSLDAQQGKGRKITSTHLGSSAPVATDISPDGSDVAVQMPVERRIRVLSLNGGPSRDVAITGWALDPTPFYWSADGAGWYVSSTSPRYPAGTDLLRIDLNGHVRVVFHQNVRDWTSAIPSPDRRHIALTQASTVSNVWMLKDF
jgi:serine/threonine protein kinase